MLSTVTQSIAAFALLVAAQLPDLALPRTAFTTTELKCSAGHRHSSWQAARPSARPAAPRAPNRQHIQILSFGP